MTLYAFVLILWSRARKLDENYSLPSLYTNDRLPFIPPALNLIGWFLLPWTINPTLKVHLYSHDARPCREESPFEQLSVQVGGFTIEASDSQRNFFKGGTKFPFDV